MFKHKLYALKIVCLTLITVMIVYTINNIMTPKYYFNEYWPTTTGLKGFYNMEENSIDVLFLGTSHAASAYNPQAMYDSYGVRSYSLACEQQNLLSSYYWLKEALRFQTPKVVIVDPAIMFVHLGAEDKPLNSDESYTRKAIDAMRWSKVKWEAVNDICKYDENQTVTSYVFLNERYHARWTGLSEEDFSSREMEKHYELKGFVPLDYRGMNAGASYQPYTDTESAGYDNNIAPVMQMYLDKMIDLCNEKGIGLVIAKTPSLEWSIEKRNTMEKYALEKGVIYWDFNDEALYNGCGFDFLNDMNEDEHVNIWGSEKLSSYIGNILCNAYGISGGDHLEQWENTRQYYQEVKNDCTLKNTDDIFEYIDLIKQDRYTVLMAVKGDTEYFLTDELKDKFRELGLEFELSNDDSYCAIISEGKIAEEVAHEPVSLSGTTRNKRVSTKVSSSGYRVGNRASIQIRGGECARNGNGINIVVYSNSTWKVLDTMNYCGTLFR